METINNLLNINLSFFEKLINNTFDLTRLNWKEYSQNCLEWICDFLKIKNLFENITKFEIFVIQFIIDNFLNLEFFFKNIKKPIALFSFDFARFLRWKITFGWQSCGLLLIDLR